MDIRKYRSNYKQLAENLEIYRRHLSDVESENTSLSAGVTGGTV
jgi:hypothetical protein